MPFGILECPPSSSSSYRVVPGTAVLREQNDVPREYRDVPLAQLKKGKGRFAHVVLVPQPSDDADDPLNVSELSEP